MAQDPNVTVVQVLFSLLGGAAAGVAIVAFLGRRIVEHLFSRNLENHRAQLQLEATREAERLRVIGNVSATEHEILLSRLQDRRATVIGELYEKFVMLERKIRQYATSGQDQNQELFTSVWNAQFDVLEYFDLKQIWIPKECCEKVQEFAIKLRTTLTVMHVYRPGQPLATPEYQIKASEKWLAAWEDMEKNIPAARQALAQELRRWLDPRMSR